MVMSDVKEEEVVSRVTKMAAELHFSGDRSSISGMKVPAEHLSLIAPSNVSFSVKGGGTFGGPQLFSFCT